LRQSKILVCLDADVAAAVLDDDLHAGIIRFTGRDDGVDDVLVDTPDHGPDELGGSCLIHGRSYASCWAQ
jgi:hypothetical protein